MKRETKYKILFGLMLLAIVVSIVLSFIPLEEACGGTLSKPSSCTIVQTSQYETTFGIKNPYIGLVAFPILAILIFFEIKKPKKRQKRAITIGMSIASILALYFLYIQFFVLNAICKYCMIVDFAVLASMILIIFWDEK